MNDSSAPPDGPSSSPATAPAGRMRVSRWRWWLHLLLITAYPVFIGAAGWAGGAAHGPALSQTPHGLMIACVAELLIFGVAFGLAWLASRASADDLLLRWRNGFWPVPAGIGYSVALRVALGVVMALAGAMLIGTRLISPEALQHFFTANRPDVEAIVDISSMRDNPLYFWLTVTFVSFVLAGLREELWRSAFLGGLRALWPGRFGSRAGQIAAAAVAAVIFGFGHLPQGLVAAILAGLLGLGLGVIMVLHRSIWPAVFAHGMFDATSLALLPWAMQQLQPMHQALGH
jgi:membrane protease YdiL (CAAX protease family)